MVDIIFSQPKADRHSIIKKKRVYSIKSDGLMFSNLEFHGEAKRIRKQDHIRASFEIH